MEDGRILDRQLTASSSYSPRDGPQYARLNSQAGAGGWVSAENFGYYGYQCLQIDLENPHIIVTRVATQGRTTWNQWVTAYKLQYSNDGKTSITTCKSAQIKKLLQNYYANDLRKTGRSRDRKHQFQQIFLGVK